MKTTNLFKYVARCVPVVLLATHAIAAPPPTATFTLEPSVTLPGLPVAFNVAVMNPSDESVTMLDVMTLEVTTASDRFSAKAPGNRTNPNLPTDAADPCGSQKCFTIPAHGQRQLFINYGPELASNEFFADERLNMPGTYALQLSLYIATGATPIQIKTNSSTLTISNPAGVDAQVWQFLRDQSPSHVWTLTEWAVSTDALASHLRTTYPASAYIPWVAALGRVDPHDKALAEFEQALATNPTPSLRDNILWVKAAYLAQSSRNALYTDRDLDKALSLADQARAAYTTLQKVAISEMLRKRATDELGKLFTASTAKATLQQLGEADLPAPAKLVPHVDCVSKASGNEFTAQFGYINPNDASKVLQLGNLNQVSPAPRDQGQPRKFKPGDHRNVFTASSPGGELKWHLDGSQAVASADFAVPCSAP